jgi:hypothetical protein
MRENGTAREDSPHEGARGSNELSGSCYCQIFGFKVIIIVHIEVLTLAHINAGVTDWIKSGWGGERYYHASQIGFRVKTGQVRGMRLLVNCKELKLIGLRIYLYSIQSHNAVNYCSNNTPSVKVL